MLKRSVNKIARPGKTMRLSSYFISSLSFFFSLWLDMCAVCYIIFFLQLFAFFLNNLQWNMFSHFKEEGRVGKFSLNAQVAFEIFHLPKRISEREEWEILSEQVSEENKEKVFGVTQVKKAFTKFISPIDRTALKKRS